VIESASAAPDVAGVPPDFRDEAVAASLAALAQRHLPSDADDLTSLGLSICLRARGDAQRFKSGVRVRLKVTLITAVVSFAIAKLASAGIRAHGRFNVAVDWIGGIFVSLAFIFLIVAVAVYQRDVRRYLRTIGAARFPFKPTVLRRAVEISNPLTADRIGVPDDIVNVAVDAERKLLLMEGYSHRYVVRAEDVHAFYTSRPRSRRRLTLTYRIAGTTTALKLAFPYTLTLAEAMETAFGVAVQYK